MALAPAAYLPKSFFGLPLYIGVELVLGIALLNKVAGFYGVLSLFTGHPIEPLQWVFYLSSLMVIPFYINGFLSVKHPNLQQFSLISLIYVIDTVAGILFIIHFSYQWFSANGAVATQTANTETATIAQESVTSNSVVSSSFSSDSISTPVTKTPTIEPSIASSSSRISTTTSTIKSTDPAKQYENYEIEDPNVGDGMVDTDESIELEAPALAKRAIPILVSGAYSLVSRGSDIASQSASPAYELTATIFTCIVVIGLRIYFTLILLSFTRLLLKSSKYGVNSDDFNNRKNLNGDLTGWRKWLNKLENKSVDSIMWFFKE